jgi:DNA polymerase III subunit epsilon
MKIKRDLVVLDVESTGVWVEKDKIIEIALIKYRPDQTREVLEAKINPGIKIPAVASELTGITDEDVKDAPSFKEVAPRILEFLRDADLGGFNVERFDLVLLKREFSDAGFDYDWTKSVIYDAQTVYHVNEKRNLAAAYEFYCAKELVGAHSALVDTEATLEIIEKQVEKYGDGADDIEVLQQFKYKPLFDFYDAERKFCWWNGKLYPMFGKYARQTPLEEITRSDPGYLKWILKANFSESVKNVVQAVLNGQKIEKAKQEI